MTTAALGEGVSRSHGFDRFRIRLLTAITVGYGLSYTCRLALGVVKKPLLDGGVWTPTQLGTIGSALLLAYAVGKFFNGFLADHVNVRKFVAIGFLLSAAANVAMIGVTSTALAATLWGLNGWFQAFGAPGCIITLARHFDDDERGRAYGIWSSSHSIGEGLTFFAVGNIAALLGWQSGFWSAAAFGLVAALLVLWLLPKGMRPHRPEGEAAKTPLQLLREQIKVLAIWPVWLLGLASAANYVTRYGINSWGMLYLQEARGLSTATAAAILTASNLAGMAGSVAFGFLSDLVFDGRRPPANLLFGLIEVSGLAIAFFATGSPLYLWIGLILFGVGLGAINASVGGLFAVDIVPKPIVGAVVGVMGTFSYLGSAIQEQISGVLIERGQTTLNGVHHYDFVPVTLFWLGAAVASTVLALALWNTGPKKTAQS